MTIINYIFILFGILYIILFRLKYLVGICKDKYGPDDIPGHLKFKATYIEKNFKQIIINLLLSIAYIVSGILI